MDTIMLIAEDHAYMRALLREFVQAAFPQLRILEAADGAAVMDICAAHAPAVVLMDINLPDANGIALTAQIKRSLPECAVIVVSESSEDTFIEGAHAAGAFAYVVKKNIYTQLAAHIAQALATARKSGNGQ